MENKFLIDLSIKYGLNTSQISRLVDVMYQCGCKQLDDERARKIADFVCENDMVEMAVEELLEEIKLKGIV